MSWVISTLSTWREPGGFVEDIHRAETGQPDGEEVTDPDDIRGPDEG